MLGLEWSDSAQERYFEFNMGPANSEIPIAVFMVRWLCLEIRFQLSQWEVSAWCKAFLLFFLVKTWTGSYFSSR